MCLCCVPVLHAPPVCPRRLRCLPSHAYRPRPRPLSPSLPPLPPSPSSFTRSRHGNCRDGCDSMNGPAFCPLLPPAGDVPLVQGAPSRRRSTSRPSASGSSRISSRSSSSSSSSSSGAEGADAAAHAADGSRDAGHWMAGREHEVKMGGGREPAAYNQRKSIPTPSGAQGGRWETASSPTAAARKTPKIAKFGENGRG